MFYLNGCPGSGGLDPNHVAYAILQGVKTGASFRPLQCLTNIRLVLNKFSVFLAFKKRAMQMFPSAVINTGNSCSSSSWGTFFIFELFVTDYKLSVLQLLHKPPQLWT